MNKNLFLKELKRNRKNLTIWLAIVIAFTLMVTAIFPYMAEMGESMTLLINKIPPELAKALGMDAQTWSSILGFYSTYYGVYIVVLISIYTASTGATIISKEEKDKTSEFLLTRPISRETVIVTKLLCLLFVSMVIFCFQTIAAAIFVQFFAIADVHWDLFLKMHFSGLVIVLFFGATGVLISMLVTPKKNFMGIVVGLTFGTYFLNAIGKSTEAVSWISYFSPFNYMRITIDAMVTFNYIGATSLLLIAIIFLFIAGRIYLSKDIQG